MSIFIILVADSEPPLSSRTPKISYRWVCGHRTMWALGGWCQQFPRGLPVWKSTGIICPIPWLRISNLPLPENANNETITYLEVRSRSIGYTFLGILRSWVRNQNGLMRLFVSVFPKQEQETSFNRIWFHITSSNSLYIYFKCYHETCD